MTAIGREACPIVPNQTRPPITFRVKTSVARDVLVPGGGSRAAPMIRSGGNSGCGWCGYLLKCLGFVERFAVLEAMVELTDEFVE